MTVWLTIAGGAVGVFMTGIWLTWRVLGDMASDEVRGWLDIAPRAILRLASARLNREQRDRLYYEEWLPELQFIMREAETRPITRAIRAISFALGLLMAARAVSRLRPPAAPAATADDGRSMGPAAMDDRSLDVVVDINGLKHVFQAKNLREVIYDHNGRTVGDIFWDAKKYLARQTSVRRPTSSD